LLRWRSIDRSPHIRTTRPPDGPNGLLSLISKEKILNLIINVSNVTSHLEKRVRNVKKN
jgi:hypothetical protein